MSSIDDFEVRLGCYKVGPDEGVLRGRSLAAADDIFRFRWVIAHKGADQNQPAIADLYIPDKEDSFVLSFDPPLVEFITVAPQKDSTMAATEKVPRVKVNRADGTARYGLTLAPPPAGSRPQGWPTTPVTIAANAGADPTSTADNLVTELNKPDQATGAQRPWEAFKVTDVGIEFRLRDPTAFPGSHLSALLLEMSVSNASSPPDVITVLTGDDLFDSTQRLKATTKTVGDFIDDCKQVDESAVVARAVTRLRELLGSKQAFRGASFDECSNAFARGIYSRLAREFSLEDLLRDSRRERADAFAAWFNGHIEDCAAELHIDEWEDSKKKDFKITLTRASRIVIREVDEALQGKQAIALAMAMGSVIQTQTRGQEYTALPELCGMEKEVDATPFKASSGPNPYVTAKVTIQWTHDGQSREFGLYRPDGNYDCFNGATVPTVGPPKPELLEDGLFVAQPDASNKRPVFKSTTGDGLVSIRICNATAQSYWPAFFVYLSDDKNPPSLDTALQSKWFSVLSAVDPSRQPIDIPLPTGEKRQTVVSHWHAMLPSEDWTSNDRTNVKPKYVWLFARSVAGGWLPPIAVKRTSSSFGLKLPSSLSGLDPNQIPRLSAGTPEPPRLKTVAADKPPEIVVRTGTDGKIYLDVVVNAPISTSQAPGYFEKYGINQLHMLVFRRQGDLPPQRKVATQRITVTRQSSDIQDDVAYYEATGWYKTLLESGWVALPDVGVYPNPSPTSDEITLSYPTPVVGGWKYVAVVIAKRPPDLCYQVPRTGSESGNAADHSYFPVTTYVPDGVLLKADAPQAWRYLASGYDTGSMVPVQRDKSIRFEYSEAAITMECYLPSPETTDVVTLIPM